MPSDNPTVLKVEGLRTEFRTDDGVVKAVDDVSFQVAKGETLAVVGESGSGKSVASLSIMGLVPQPPGKILSGKAWLHDRDLLAMTQAELRQVRGRKLAMIFQDPMTSLNPFLTIGDQLTEVTRLHLGHTSREARDHAVKMLSSVGIPSPERRLDDYPHQFSGGMRQRVMIAMALSCDPDVLIADEPTTALDVTIQAQILELMKKLQQDHGTAILLITHDMGVVANMAHRVHVMYAGRVVEEASVDELFQRPLHPYTDGLLRSMPRLDQPLDERLRPIDGQAPDLTRLTVSCAFHPRCSYSESICETTLPPLFDAGGRRHACLVQNERGIDFKKKEGSQP